MFPLGVVLFPGAILPLQVFEPRYQRLVSDLSDHSNRFGVVLIRRGHEVGGGDERHDVGTVAEVVHKEDVGNGVFLLNTIGRERIRVTEWLADDPYPRALVAVVPAAGSAPDLPAAVAVATNARKRLLGIAVELGANRRNLEVELPDDPEQAAWTLCNTSPVGPYDRQCLLEIDDPVERMHTLEQILNTHTEDLQRAMEH